MYSKRKERVLISCVSFEVAKVVDPAIYYEATRIHLIHYSRKEDVYKEFYTEVTKQIRERLPKSNIIEHNEYHIYNFEEMMRLILVIIREEQKNAGGNVDIYVNTSSGPSEYTAASLMASMMVSNVIPFNVSSEKYQISVEKVREMYYEDGHPIGMTKTTKEPNALSTYTILMPNDDLVLGLSILNDQIKARKSTAAPDMIRLLNDVGLMYYTKTATGKPDQKSTMRYQRNYVDHWLKNGWVKKVSKREMKITDDGDTVLNIFLEAAKINKNCHIS